MRIKTIVAWAVIVFLAYALLTKPSGAGAAVRDFLHWLKDAGASIATFLNSA